MLSFIVGYLIVINIISMIFMYIDTKQIILKLSKKTINFIYIILAIIGGSVGILVTSQLFSYKNDEKIIKRGIPLIIFIEIVAILFIYIKINDIEIF